MEGSGTEGDRPSTKPHRRGARIGASAGFITAGLLAGAILAGTHVAGAATTSASTAAATARPVAGQVNPATMTHGPGETLLTGTNADKAKAAALAAVPGGTIIRVETDSAGSPYEAHVRKSDGSIVTVKLDASFKVTSIQSGFGAGPGQPPMGATGL
jgi:hypothetical protein